MSTGKRYLMGMLSGAGSVVLRSALNILVVPIIIAKLGLDTFGLYIVLLAILEVANLLDMGATNAIVTLLGGENQEQTRRSILKVGNAWFGALSVLFFILGLLFRDQFCHLFHITPALQGVAMTSLLFMLVEAALSIYSYYCYTVLLAHCAHQWANLADSVSNLLGILGSLAALLAGYGLVEIMEIRLAAAAIRLVIMLWQTACLEPAAFRPQVPFSLDTFKTVARLSGHAMMVNFSIIISHKIDDLVIAHFLPLSAVGIYEIVFRFLGITLQIGLKLCVGIYPVFAKLATAGQVEEARQFFLRKSAFLNMVSALILLIIVAFYPELFALFSAGQIPMQQTLPILAVAIPCVQSGVLQMPANAWLFTWGHQRFVSTTSLIAALANLALSIILVQYWGIIGVAIGTLIPQLLQHQAGLIGKTCKALGISATEYIRAVHVKALLPLLAAGGWVILFRPTLSHSLFLIPTIGLIALSACLLGAALWFRLSATPQEAEMLNRMTQKLFSFRLFQCKALQFKHLQPLQPLTPQQQKFSHKIDPDQA